MSNAASKLRKLLGLARAASADTVKRRYYERIKELHPDHAQPHAALGRSGLPEPAFLELQAAWERFQREPSAALRHAGGSFNKVGVGCSFSDTEEERAERQAVMEAAALGRLGTRPQSLLHDDQAAASHVREREDGG